MKKYLLFVCMALPQFIFAGEINMPKELWLSNLEKILPAHLCKPKSPLLKVYKGNGCVTDMKKLYRKCTTEVENVVLPSYITNVQMANTLGQIVAECMFAHYQGGQALKVFNLIQSMSNK